MRVSIGMRVLIYGTGTPTSCVPKDFDGQGGFVDYADEETDDQWVWVRMDGDTKYRVHAIQCRVQPENG